MDSQKDRKEKRILSPELQREMMQFFLHAFRMRMESGNAKKTGDVKTEDIGAPKNAASDRRPRQNSPDFNEGGR